MSVGLIALLDDVASLAKVAAASLDDIAGQAAKAGTKAAGVVIDDAAVTPRYVTGFKPERELPIIWKITLGSLKNKLVFLLPIALLLGAPPSATRLEAMAWPAGPRRGGKNTTASWAASGARRGCTGHARDMQEDANAVQHFRTSFALQPGLRTTR